MGAGVFDIAFVVLCVEGRGTTEHLDLVDMTGDITGHLCFGGHDIAA